MKASRTLKGPAFLCLIQRGIAFFGVHIMASTLHAFEKLVMIEKQSINGRDVWLQVEPYHVQRSNPDIIPTEYFTAKYYFQEPNNSENGEVIKDEEGETKLFESPVAALSYANKSLVNTI